MQQHILILLPFIVLFRHTFVIYCRIRPHPRGKKLFGHSEPFPSIPIHSHPFRAIRIHSHPFPSIRNGRMELFPPWPHPFTLSHLLLFQFHLLNLYSFRLLSFSNFYSFYHTTRSLPPRGKKRFLGTARNHRNREEPKGKKRFLGTSKNDRTREEPKEGKSGS